jgi:hypothetical protein
MQEFVFGQPVLLYYSAPDGWNRYRNRPAEERDLRQAELEVTVSAEGRTKAPKVLDDSGDPRRGAQAERAAETAIYRARWADGEPIETPGVRFVQPFYVLREAAKPAEAESPAPTPRDVAPAEGTTRDDAATSEAPPPGDAAQGPGPGD